MAVAAALVPRPRSSIRSCATFATSVLAPPAPERPREATTMTLGQRSVPTVAVADVGVDVVVFRAAEARGFLPYDTLAIVVVTTVETLARAAWPMMARP